ncbi:Fructose-bisphosphatase [Handroanthus impetiginosus]|uniref:Fructose-bisphosphatase n=1 Tax=Handroanthus impetiginosus TaxID=429701 RepID=A0A2G9I549_9LAMI|nr:Fructose-bisphosphatase [Handroanthus impetiginosus]
MAEAVVTLRWNNLNSASLSISRHSPLHRRRSYCAPSPATPAAAKTKIRKSRYEVENLTTWLLKQEQADYIDAELTIVLSSISLACKQIASLLQRSNIINLTGCQGTINIQGEDQKKTRHQETYSGNYIVVFDPIDGSANIDTSLTTGSIFGIYGPDKQCLFYIDDDSTHSNSISIKIDSIRVFLVAGLNAFHQSPE